MADIVEKIKFDDSELIASLQNIDKKMEDLNKKVRETEMSYEEAFAVAAKSLEEAEKATEETKTATTKLAAETAKAAKSSGEFRATLKEQIRDLNLFGQNVGGVIDGLQKKATALRSVTGALGGGTKALQVFKVALISTGIGAIVVALGSFVALLTRTQKGIDTVNVVMKSLGATISVLVDRAAKFGGSLVKLFSGDFKGAINDAKAAVSGLGAEIAKEVQQAAALERRVQALRDANRELNVEYAQRRKEIKELNLLGEDTTKSEAERVKALKAAGAIERDLLAKRKAAAEEELAIIKEKNEASESLAGDLDAEAEAKINLANIEAESLELQTTLQNKLNAVETEARAKREAAFKERQAQIAKINEELTKQIELIEKAYQQAELNKLSPAERVLAEAEIAKKQVEIEFQKLDELAKAAGKEVDLTKEKAEIIAEIERQSIEEIKKIRQEGYKEVFDLQADEKKRTEEALKKSITDSIKAIKPALDQEAPRQIRGIEVTLAQLKDKITSRLGLSPDETAAIMQGVTQVFDLWRAGTEAAIQQNENIINSIQSRREAIEEDLEEQLALQEKGLANNVSAKQAELEALKKEEEKALKERERLLKAQAKQQLIADSVAQISNLTTMASGILAQSGKLGILGIPLAISTIATMIGIFTAFKAQAKSATADAARFASGGSLDDPRVTGFVNKSGRTDRHGGRGHRVEDSNVILGGREFVVSEGPAHRHAEFLEALNAGRFDGTDLMDELRTSHVAIDAGRTADKFARRAEVIGRIRQHGDRQFQAQAMDAIFGKHIGRMVSGLSRLGGETYVIPKGGGKVVHVAPDGSRKVVDHS